MQHGHLNDLARYRRRMRFTQFQVAKLLGWKNTKAISMMEAGKGLPNLMTALKLGIIYRAPLEFLFNRTYQALRVGIRIQEEVLKSAGQQVLPLTYVKNQ